MGTTKLMPARSTRYLLMAFRARIVTVRISRCKPRGFSSPDILTASVTLKDLKTGEETIVAFKAGE